MNSFSTLTLTPGELRVILNALVVSETLQEIAARDLGYTPERASRLNSTSDLAFKVRRHLDPG